MIGTIIFVYLLYRLLKNPADKRNSDLFKVIIGGTVGLTVLSILIAAFTSSGLGGLAIMCLIGYCIFKNKKKNEQNAQQEKYGNVNQSVRDSYYKNDGKQAQRAPQYSSAKVPPSNGKLPSTIGGRRKQIEDFNKKYDLYLTDDQIESMVNSSFLSVHWKREIQDMGVKYDTLHQWFTGPTAWLRVYIHAFIPQEITSDFAMQEQIAIHSFEEVFSYVDTLGSIPLKEKIDRVNDKFFAQFDDITFMVAFRYLESKGYEHSMNIAQPLHSDSYMDDLEKKYQTADA